VRLRRGDPGRPGYGRRRRGRGFSYVDERGAALTDPAALRRCRELAIPPAWRDVWICPDPAGHLQATGVDAAGRRQYLYHEQWRVRRDRRKFAHVLVVAPHLARLRRRVATDLRGEALSRDRVLALAVRLIDLGLFRIGNDQYANDDDPTFGVATLQCGHVRCPEPGTVRFRYRAKGGIDRELSIRDPAVATAVRRLIRRRGGSARLLAYPEPDRGWREVHSADINAYLRRAAGAEMTAKDLRTWHATVAAAVALARAARPASATAARRCVAQVMRQVAEDLGNTPAVARASYVDPRVVDLFLRGRTIDLPRRCRPDGPRAERAVLELLAGGR
jgi:DNA topoisomerase-1